MWQQIVHRSFSTVSRQMTAIKRHSMGKNALLSAPVQNSGRRFMSHGPDISKLEAALYIIIGGGGFAAFGIYSTMNMRDRIEAFEKGEIIPFKSLTDGELLEFREKFREMHGGDEEE